MSSDRWLTRSNALRQARSRGQEKIGSVTNIQVNDTSRPTIEISVQDGMLKVVGSASRGRQKIGKKN